MGYILIIYAYVDSQFNTQVCIYKRSLLFTFSYCKFRQKTEIATDTDKRSPKWTCLIHDILKPWIIKWILKVLNPFSTKYLNMYVITLALTIWINIHNEPIFIFVHDIFQWIEKIGIVKYLCSSGKANVLIFIQLAVISLILEIFWYFKQKWRSGWVHSNPVTFNGDVCKNCVKVSCLQR